MQIPKQMVREELRKRIQLHWFTNYENIHKSSHPLVAVDLTFQTMLDGTVKTSFVEPDSKDDLSTTPASTKNDPHHDILVQSLRLNNCALGRSLPLKSKARGKEELSICTVKWCPRR